MIVDGNNTSFNKNDAKKVRCFEIKDANSFRGAFVRSVNLGNSIDGLLVEHKNWYDPSECKVLFDPRLYIIVKGNDGINYAVSFRDDHRKFLIERYEGHYGLDFIETKIIKAEELIDDYVQAKLNNVSSFLSPSDPLNIYKEETIYDENCFEEKRIYSIETSALLGLKLMIEINNLRNEGIQKIVVSYDDEYSDYLNTFFIKTLYTYSSKSSFVPMNVFSFYIPNEDLIVCNQALAKEYEKSGYKLIELRKKEPNESILSRRLERRDKYDRY